jgi:hypothetical protein
VERKRKANDDARKRAQLRFVPMEKCHGLKVIPDSACVLVIRGYVCLWPRR